MPSKSTWHSVPSTSLDSVRRLDLFKQFMPNRTMRFWGLDVFFMCMKIYSVSANTLIIYQLKVLCELSCWYIYVSVVGVEICGTQLGGMEVIQVLRYFHWWWGDIGELAMDVQADADKRSAHACLSFCAVLYITHFYFCFDSYYINFYYSFLTVSLNDSVNTYVMASILMWGLHCGFLLLLNTSMSLARYESNAILSAC